MNKIFQIDKLTIYQDLKCLTKPDHPITAGILTVVK